MQQCHLKDNRAQQAPETTHSYTSRGLPVNTDKGAMRTESRGVFVSGLNYKARSRDVRSLFGKAGEISQCKVQKNTSMRRSKGKATVRCGSAAGAQQVINMFHGKLFMDMALNVRLDTEKTRIDSPSSTQPSISRQPIIVNGSQVR
ncbi:hypothetical protein LTR17_018476 [Elasticomyces elasticus]|nr:hypothetical protein LTR17_018476 [Elasticomyces elasticus]